MPAKASTEVPPSKSFVDDVPEVATNAPLMYEQEEGGDESINRQRPLFVMGLLSFGIISGLAVCLMVLAQYVNRTPAVALENVVEDVLPTAIPTPVFRASSVTLDIRNASGVKGAASKLGDMLEAKGYTVVSVGNAPVRDTSQLLTTLSESDLAAFTADIASVFSGTNSGKPTDTTASAQILIGKDWK